MSTACLSPHAPTLHDRVAPGEPRPRRTRTGAVHAAVVGLAVMLTIGGGAAAWSEVTGPQQPTTVGLEDRTSMGGLEVVVSRFERRADAVAGVNTSKQPMSGPAMPMLTPQVDTKPQPGDPAPGETGGAGMAGMSGMPGMSGMAGALKEGEERIDVDLSMQNPGDEAAASLDPTKLELLSDGRPVPLSQPTKSDVTVTTLPAGYAIAGTVNFIIPQGTAPLELRYRGETSVVVLESSTAAPEHRTASEGSASQH